MARPHTDGGQVGNLPHFLTAGGTACPTLFGIDLYLGQAAGAGMLTGVFVRAGDFAGGGYVFGAAAAEQVFGAVDLF
jgi:hypothetical protein